jgi:hypothetical protein
LLVITNVINIGFDAEVAGIIKEYAQHNAPFVKGRAVVGISVWSKVVFYRN